MFYELDSIACSVAFLGFLVKLKRGFLVLLMIDSLALS